MIARPAQLAVAARPPSPAWTLVIASAGAFMTCVDTMVVTTALPVLRVSLHGTLADLEWTVNAYNLAFACLLLAGATLGDRFGRRRMFCIGLAAFTAASAAAALSPTAGALIAARAVQGAAAALVLPLTLTLISDAFSPGRGGHNRPVPRIRLPRGVPRHRHRADRAHLGTDHGPSGQLRRRRQAAAVLPGKSAT